MSIGDHTVHSLSEYLRGAWENNEASWKEPEDGEPYRTPMFEFVRLAKAHPTLSHLDGFAAMEAVAHCLAGWDEAVNDPWEEYFCRSDDPQSEFVDTWDKIKFPRAILD